MYQGMAYRLYCGATVINGTRFDSPIDYIEACHDLSQFKGRIFYQNLMRELRVLFEATKSFHKDYHLPLYNDLMQYCESRINELPNSKKQNQKKEIKEEQLEDIWLKGKEHYQKVIHFLTTSTCGDNDKPFVKIINGNPVWNCSNVILGAFISRCKNQGFIHSHPNLSVTRLEKIINKTFATKLNTSHPLREDHIPTAENKALFEPLKSL